MPLDLPGPGEIRYGRFTFPDGYTHTVQCAVTPQYDAGRRTVTHSVWDLTLQTYVEGSPVDAVVQAAVAELTKAGQAFTYVGHGPGTLKINQGGIRDVAWGPLPRVVSVKPFPPRTSQITWQVSVSVPTCADAVYAFSPLEYSFSLTFDIAKNGFTTRNYRAKLRIPNNRAPVGGRLMLDSPDAYRETIVPAVPPGFKRTAQSYTIDESKTTITATATDEQLGPNALPSFIVDGSASHTYASVPGSVGASWVGTIEALFEVARYADIQYAVGGFFDLAKERMAIAGQMIEGAGIPGAVPGAKKKATVILSAFNISEPQIYEGGLRGRFSCIYKIAGVGLSEILRSGGLWQKAGDPAGWYATIKDATGPRGVAGLRFNANEDYLVDLCGKAVPSPPKAPPPINLTAVGKGIGAAVLAGIMNPKKIEEAFPKPDADGGWIDVKCGIEVEESHGTVVAPALPTKPLTEPAATPAGWDILRQARPQDGDQGQGQPVFPPARDYVVSGVSPSQQATGADVQVQRRRAPVAYIIVRGEAFRLGHPIPCPQAFDVNGKPLVNCNRLDRGEGFFQAIVGHAIYPIHYASWTLRYHATEAVLKVGDFPVPPNTLG